MLRQLEITVLIIGKDFPPTILRNLVAISIMLHACDCFIHIFRAAFRGVIQLGDTVRSAVIDSELGEVAADGERTADKHHLTDSVTLASRTLKPIVSTAGGQPARDHK
jgi:hypothetical protein